MKIQYPVRTHLAGCADAASKYTHASTRKSMARQDSINAIEADAASAKGNSTVFESGLLS